MLQVEGLHVEVAGRPVLHGVTFRIAPGETHVLFGPNCPQPRSSASARG
jgi:Fe-S cluster assembly ATP-binding protein